MSRGQAAALLEVLERAMFVSPSLRSLLTALPDAIGPEHQAQVDAVAGAVVLNAWLCCGEDALELLERAEVATDGVFRLAPESSHIVIDGAAAVQVARAAVLGVTSRLGFSPGRRAAIGQAVSSLANALLAAGGGHLELSVRLTRQRELVIKALTARAEVGAALDEALSRLRKTANTLAESREPNRPYMVRAQLVARPLEGAASSSGTSVARLRPPTLAPIPPTDRVEWTARA